MALTTYLNAGWMFVNDDGSLSSYHQEDESYFIPQEVEKPKKTKVRKKHHKRKKRVVTNYEPIEQNGEKTIYLTFDDGPLNGTENVIDVLSQTGTAATMFMIGKHIDSSEYRKELFLNAIDEPYILVANHTYSHIDIMNASETVVQEDIKKANKAVQKCLLIILMCQKVV
jgi:peptidoglycan/xylan/chitin deacetylase (PgdA/CDA1 family)